MPVRRIALALVLFVGCAGRRPPLELSLRVEPVDYTARFEPCFETALIKPRPRGADDATDSGATGGGVMGVVMSRSGVPLARATVVASGPALQGTQAELTDATGRYHLVALRPGRYTIAFHYEDLVAEQEGVEVSSAAPATVNQSLDVRVVEISQSIVVDQDYIRDDRLTERNAIDRGASRCTYWNRCGFEHERPPCR